MLMSLTIKNKGKDNRRKISSSTLKIKDAKEN
jgi:hypothetical protein